MLALVANNGLSVVPNKNLVTNIGFTGTATHTNSDLDSYLSHPTRKLKFPLKHPPFVIRDRVSDERYARWAVKNKIKKFFLLKTKLYKIFK